MANINDGDEEINESDCCGNGCSNCILNIKPAKSKIYDKIGKQNILNKYTKFCLIDKTLHLVKVQNVWELHFKSKEISHNGFILDINPGYHLMMRRSLPEFDKLKEKNKVERKYLLRPYSPYWWDVIEMEFKILVNLKPNGPMSKYIENFKIDDDVEFRGPIGSFDYEADVKGEKCLLIITQGVAIAPVIPIIKNVLNNDDDMTKIIHLSCFQDLQHIYFREKLREFQQYWNYKVCIYLSKEICENTDCLENKKCLENCKNFKNKLKYKETIHPYRLTQQELQKIISRFEYKKEQTIIILAGTGIFQAFYKDLLKSVEYGFQEDNIYLL